jgi:hypothetical protein
VNGDIQKDYAYEIDFQKDSLSNDDDITLSNMRYVKPYLFYYLPVF